MNLEEAAKFLSKTHCRICNTMYGVYGCTPDKCNCPPPEGTTPDGTILDDYPKEDSDTE